MFRQVVAHRWSPHADEQDRAGFRAALEALRAVPEVSALRHGTDAALFPGNHDYVSVIDFPDREAARRYVDAPLHRRFVAAHASRVVSDRVVVQHEWGAGEVTGLHHVKLPVRDVGRSRDWYGRCFGLEVEHEFEEEGRPVGVALRQPGGGLRVALREDPPRAAALAGFDALCLAVGTRADLDAVLARLDGLGVVHGEPAAGRGGEAVDVPDPDGHLVRLHTLV